MDVSTRVSERLVPFDVKYQNAAITQRWKDFGRMPVRCTNKATPDKRVGEVVAIPAPLACYWMSAL
ncbi:MAG: hypothetical protein ACT4NV_03125 [Rhodoferax sp.]